MKRKTKNFKKYGIKTKKRLDFEGSCSFGDGVASILTVSFLELTIAINLADKTDLTESLTCKQIIAVFNLFDMR